MLKTFLCCRQRATVLKRHFLAQWRRKQKRQLNRLKSLSDVSTEKENDVEKATAVTSQRETVADKKAPAVPQRSTSTTSTTATSAAHGLARLGSRTALSFAFAFLRRAWRSGEDSDLCSDLLQVKIRYDVALTLIFFQHSLNYGVGNVNLALNF